MRSKAISSLFLILLFYLGTSAQEQEDMNSEWVAEDVAAIKQFLPALAQPDLTLESLEKLFGYKAEQEDLGFGVRTFFFANAAGYTRLTVNGVESNGQIGNLTIRLAGDDEWAKIKTTIVAAWKANGQLEFKEKQYSIEYYREYPNVIAILKEAVKLQLGEVKSVRVPRRLNDAYTYLMLLGENSVVGSQTCDVAHIVPYGKSAIDQIVAARRIDLVENILRGYNPGGRMYALLALLKKQRAGTRLSDETQQAMRSILNLDIGLKTCKERVPAQLKAKDIVADW